MSLMLAFRLVPATVPVISVSCAAICLSSFFANTCSWSGSLSCKSWHLHLAIWAVLIQRIQSPRLNRLDKKLNDLSEQEHTLVLPCLLCVGTARFLHKPHHA